MWSEQKIQSKKDYFAKQRKEPTGYFTEYVVRTYYSIYEGCSLHKSHSCPAREVSNYKIKDTVYAGFYNNQPDHDYNSVINDCKNHLINMGYIHLEQKGGNEFVFIDKPLDFLVPSEHESYLRRYGILDREFSEFKSRSDIQINPIKNQNKLTALLNHMIDPEHHLDPFDGMHISDTDSSKGFSCELCDGHYIIRSGIHGTFFGCSNYPKCKSTKTIQDKTYSWLETHGIHIYEVEQPCWKCGKSIKLRSYFPHIDLISDQPELAKKLDLTIIRLGMIETLDKYLSSNYEEIYMRFSKQFNGEYMANNCPHCRSLQGSTMSLESMYHFLADAVRKQQALTSHISETIAVNEIFLSKKEWKDIVTEVLKFQR
ncbi:MAG: putative C-terminal domain of topoisomerase [Bacillota bacterium]|jgi:ssDNA-binding Zn-finger/Zn-ribbon topoisomerase 1|nr:putative C-terminal domain of topoisomerase [Bacillota bacterium]